MTRATIFLITRSLKNAIVRAVRRLRQPRYIAGAILAAIYFWTFLFRRSAASNTEVLRTGAANEAMTIFVTILALLVLIGAWALPKDSAALVFSEAEIQFLFAGPVNRRQLIAYKFFRSQVRGLFSALMFTLFVFRGSNFLGVWVAFVVLDVYTTFVAFARARLKLARIGWLWRTVAVTLIVFAIGAAGMRQFRGKSQMILDTLQEPKGAVVHTVSDVLRTPPLGPVLFVPRLFGTAIYAPSIAAAGAATAVLVLLAALFFVLTTRLNVSFEDESIIVSQRVLAQQARLRAGRIGRGVAAINRFSIPFAFAERGPAAMAIVWKNLVGAIRTSAFPMIALIMPLGLLVLTAIFGRSAESRGVIGLMGLAFTGLLVMAGPFVVRSDMRVDILRLDVVKTFPLSAESLLASEMAAPLIVVALFELMMLIVSVTILAFSAMRVPFFVSPEFVVSALVFTIPVTAIQLLIHNGAMILFPAWSLPTDEVRGFTALGQRLLLVLGNLLTLFVALLPAAALFVPSLWVLSKLIGKTPLTVLVATIPAAGVLVAEIVIAHRLLAAQFDDLDIANDLDAASA